MQKTLLALVFSAALLPSASAVAQNGSEVALGKCSRCHSLVRVCNNLGVKDHAAWTVTVSRMVERNGAPLDAAEKMSVIGYLAGLSKGAAPICKE